MPYNVNKSDPTLTTPIVVPDMPPGLNTVDTSLKLIGRNYPNFGQALAENFVHLLENFSSSTPPSNPISGQLWYDTSLLDSQILKVFDGNTWFPANGVHKQDFQPASSKFGDIWVDTKNLQLYILQGAADPILVGPLLGTTSKTGPYPAQLTDTSGNPQYVILMYIGGDVIEILSATAFTPAVVIDGFSNIAKGVTVSDKFFTSNEPQITANVSSAFKLIQNIGGSVEYVGGNNFVRNDVNQTMNGNLWINNNNGLSIGQTSPSVSLTYQGGTGRFENTVQGGDFQFVVNTSTLRYSALQITSLSNDPSAKTAINIGQPTQKSQLNVFGDIFSQRVFVNKNNQYYSSSTDVVVHAWGKIIAGSLDIGHQLTADSATVNSIVVGNPTIWPNPQPNIIAAATTGTVEIGQLATPFAKVWTNWVGNGTTTTVFNGKLEGPAAYLKQSTQFSITGRGISSTIASANGRTDTYTATIQLLISKDFVFGGSTATLALANYIVPTDAIPFASTGSTALKQVSKSVLVADLYDGRIKDLSVVGNINPYSDIVQPGTIIVWPDQQSLSPYQTYTNQLPKGWVLCDGSEYGESSGDHKRLSDVIGTLYGSDYVGGFKVPNIPDIWISDSQGYAIPPTVYTGLTTYIDLVPDTNGATFTVEVRDNKYSVSLTAPGTNYTATTMLTIPGITVGGLTPDNNISVTVASTGTGFSIASYSYIGNPATPSGIQTRRGRYIIKL